MVYRQAMCRATDSAYPAVTCIDATSNRVAQRYIALAYPVHMTSRRRYDAANLLVVGVLMLSPVDDLQVFDPFGLVDVQKTTIHKVRHAVLYVDFVVWHEFGFKPAWT